MRLFLLQLHFELVKLFAKKRTYLGYGAFLAVEIVILVLLQTRKASQMLTRSMTQHGLDFSHYFSGLTLAHVMITNTIFLLGSLYLALVCGDMVAKEVEDGTMRMILSRPVSRVRILVLKYLACVFYTWSLTIFIVISSLLLGIADRGLGGLIVVAPWDHVFGFYEAGPGMERFAWGAGILCLVMLTFSTLGFMFSCFNMKPASATIMTLSVYIIDTVVRNIPYFENFRGYFLTHHMAIWTQVFQQQLPWGTILKSIEYLGFWNLLFVFAGAFYFCRRDFKSSKWVLNFMHVLR
jgi:ABC-2 type transport system permease protein